MKVSIIVPVYNSEKYLSKCIESVLKQTYKNCEIILVDDGSIDNSGKICNDYASIDSRIHVVHKENGGLSSARNIGYEVSTGDYIFYLDSDDFLADNCIEKLLTLCIDYHSEIAIVQMMYVAENTNEQLEIEEIEKITVFTAEKAIEESLYQRLYSCCAPAKLYRRDIIQGINFPIGKLSEDLATSHLFFNRAKRVTYSNMVGYYYRQHENSIMHVFNPKRLDALEWAIQIEQFCENHYPNILQATYGRTFNVSIHLLLDLPDTGNLHDEYYDKIWKQVKRTRFKTILCRKVRYREKAAAFLSFGGERLIKKIWNSRLAIKQEEK